MMRHRIQIFQDSEFSGIRSKVLFLIGEYDRLSNYPKAIAKLEAIQIQYKLVKDAGHAINHEQAALINDEIIAFIGT
jgi:pimeloyl-ACP methyl ester carboxylesterase